MEIIIGKEGNQPFAIGDPNVSRQHAKLVADENTASLILTDLNSTNGTFIHDGTTYMRLYPNQPYKVGYDTMIRLGPVTCFHIRKLFQHEKPASKQDHQHQEKKEEEKIDITQLYTVYNKYNVERKSIEKRKNVVGGLRSLTILCTMIGGGVSYFLGGNPVITIMITVILITLLLLLAHTLDSKLVERKDKNERDYKINYCCPKCHVSLAGKYYENILAEGQCPKCKVKYYGKATM